METGHHTAHPDYKYVAPESTKPLFIPAAEPLQPSAATQAPIPEPEPSFYDEWPAFDGPVQPGETLRPESEFTPLEAIDDEPGVDASITTTIVGETLELAGLEVAELPFAFNGVRMAVNRRRLSKAKTIASDHAWGEAAIEHEGMFKGRHEPDKRQKKVADKKGHIESHYGTNTAKRASFGAAEIDTTTGKSALRDENGKLFGNVPFGLAWDIQREERLFRSNERKIKHEHHTLMHGGRVFRAKNKVMLRSPERLERKIERLEQKLERGALAKELKPIRKDAKKLHKTSESHKSTVEKLDVLAARAKYYDSISKALDTVAGDPDANLDLGSPTTRLERLARRRANRRADRLNTARQRQKDTQDNLRATTNERANTRERAIRATSSVLPERLTGKGLGSKLIEANQKAVDRKVRRVTNRRRQAVDARLSSVGRIANRYDSSTGQKLLNKRGEVVAFGINGRGGLGKKRQAVDTKTRRLSDKQYAFVDRKNHS